jgi:predicted nucleic acid-binding protein
VIHFDTSFVVDLLREASRGEVGAATALLASLDVLIATSAIREGARLVTRNSKDFSGMPGLDLISY